MTAAAKFDEAVQFINSLPEDGPYKPSNEIKLQFYGYFKQATQGPCTTSKPGILDITGKKKWEAWHGLGSMSKEDAMKNYVDLVEKVKSEATKK